MIYYICIAKNDFWLELLVEIVKRTDAVIWYINKLDKTIDMLKIDVL